MPYTKQFERETEREYHKFLMIQEQGNNEGLQVIVVEKFKKKVHDVFCNLNSQDDILKNVNDDRFIDCLCLPVDSFKAGEDHGLVGISIEDMVSEAVRE